MTPKIHLTACGWGNQSAFGSRRNQIEWSFFSKLLVLYGRMLYDNPMRKILPLTCWVWKYLFKIYSKRIFESVSGVWRYLFALHNMFNVEYIPQNKLYAMKIYSRGAILKHCFHFTDQLPMFPNPWENNAGDYTWKALSRPHTNMKTHI
jgi:hypothetical protein